MPRAYRNPAATALVLLGGLTGCIGQNTLTASSGTSTTSSSTVTIPAGAKAARIVFKPVSQGGSFAAAPSAGTVNAAGSGLAVTTVFNADGSTLSSDSTASTWPKWLSSVELGISGTNNTNASNSDCARFANAGENTAPCSFSNQAVPPGTATSCGATQGFYRVSDWDCYNSAAGTRAEGSGLATDGVYVRTTFSRNTEYLGATENIMAVLEYAASAINSAPANPSSCFSGSASALENCSDLTWRAYIKHSASEVVQPFLLLIPPALGYVNTSTPANTGTGGSGVSTRQFVIPLGGDPNLTVFQLSRIKISPTLAADPKFTTICAPSGAPANSPFCVGVVFYSLTFFRI